MSPVCAPPLVHCPKADCLATAYVPWLKVQGEPLRPDPDSTAAWLHDHARTAHPGES